MDQETAQRLYAEGAFLVFLGVPEGTEFGIDYNTWEVGPLFKGIKMIPPGMHFVHFSAVRGCGGKPGGKAEGSGPKSSGAGDRGPWGRETGPRTGFFHEFGKRELLVRKWDVGMEDAASEEVASDEVERIRASLKDLDRNLAPYPYDTLRRWVSLSGHVTGSVAARLLPLSGRVCAFAEMEPETPSSNSQQRLALNLPRNDTECSSLQEGEARLPIMKQRPGTEIRFSELPQHPFPLGASPADVTRHSLDRSLALDALLARHYPQDEHGILEQVSCSLRSCASCWAASTTHLSSGSGCWRCCAAARRRRCLARASTATSSLCSTTSSTRCHGTSSSTSSRGTTSSPPRCRSSSPSCRARTWSGLCISEPPCSSST
ncbi:protein AAR2 homolog isoform X3 [Petromyzon marinus]|uniref:Protein AAR2 homolog n=1 Tax=Petromyzon marinus TaxID=7757 RepID=A0AAJ7X964_PETMA|nr:protein AAR2 homolog isoform X4 [Petromyzon marinus]